ncbi:MAG TPA: sialidase family protein, partial [Candidatus Angelobacter sp.]
MRAAFLAGFCLCFASFSFAQLQQKPNPACPDNAWYCAAPVSSIGGAVPGVIGFHNGSLYGATRVESGSTCPGTNLPPNGSSTFCVYTTETFAPEDWVLQGQFPAKDVIVGGKTIGEFLLEIVFVPNCSGTGNSYKYLYTFAGRILRASASPDDWNFKDVAHPDSQNGFSGLPDLPADTAGRIASFAVAFQGPRTRLFYGNKSAHILDSTHPPLAQPAAYVWHSDDCGDTWTHSLPSPPGDPNNSNFGGSEIHTINVDPANARNIYVNVDIEFTDPKVTGNKVIGLWRSTDGGDTFSHVQTPGNSVTGINFAFSNATNKIFMETDDNPNRPYVFWDTVNGGPLQAGPAFPHQQIAKKGMGGCLQLGQVFTRALMLLPAQPDFFRDMVSQGCLPPGLGSQQKQTQWLAGQGSAILVTSEKNIFIGTGGFTPHVATWYFAPPFYDIPVLLQNFGTSIGFVNRTVEVTAPAQNGLGPTTYLYNTTARFVKPQFITPPLPAPGSALTSLVDPKGGQHWIYVGVDQHLYDVFWNSRTGIGFTDLTTAAGAPIVAAGSALSSLTDTVGFLHVVFLGTDQHVNQIFWSPGAWHAFEDRTVATGAPVAAAGSALGASLDSKGGQHFVYAGTNQHIYDVFWNGGLGFRDLTSAAFAPPAAPGTALSSFLDTGGSLHVIFSGNNQHVYQFADLERTVWFEDRTAATGAPLAAAGSALTSFVDAKGSQNIVFLGTDQHVYNAFWNGSFGFEDVTALAHAPIAAAGSALSSAVDTRGTQ